MSDAAESTQPQTAEAQTTEAPAQEGSLLDQIIAQGRMARDDEQRALARDLIGEFVAEVMAGEMTVSTDTQAMINARIGQIDQLLSKQLNAIMHTPEFQQLEASWRGLQLPGHEQRDGQGPQAPGHERLEEGPAQGHGAGPGVRSERPVQEGLRGGVRHLRRRPFRCPGRRLPLQPLAPGRRPARKDLQRRGRGARPVHLRSGPRTVQHGRLHRAVQPPRPDQDLRVRRVREVAVVPRFGGLSLRRSLPAAHPDAAALRPRDEPRRGFQLSRSKSTAPTTPSTSGATRPTPSRRG